MAVKKGSFTKVLLELIIVFIGVYGAFELNRYQEGIRERKIRESYFNSFYSELTKLSHDINSALQIVNKKLLVIDSPQTGKKPPLKPLDLYFSAEMLITKAGFNDDVFTQLEGGLAASLSGGYENVKVMSDMVKDFNRRCDFHLISNRPLVFYDKQGNLKEEFHWYESGLKNLKLNFDRLSIMINQEAMPATKKIIENLN